MSLEPGILDANVLIYSTAAEAPQHMAPRALLDAVRNDPGVTFYVTSQILCEFYSVVTNPRRMTVARSSAEALAAITGFLAFLHTWTFKESNSSVARVQMPVRNLFHNRPQIVLQLPTRKMRL